MPHVYALSDREKVIHERESLNRAKEAFQKIQELRGKLTSENIKKIVEEMRHILAIVMNITHELLSDQEQKELTHIHIAVSKLCIDMNMLNTSFDGRPVPEKRIILEEIKDKNLLADFMKENGNEAAKWYLKDLTLPKDSTIGQADYALGQLEKIHDILPNTEEFQDLRERILSRIYYFGIDTNDLAIKAIQNENGDEIKIHFCNLFKLPYIEIK